MTVDRKISRGDPLRGNILGLARGMEFDQLQGRVGARLLRPAILDVTDRRDGKPAMVPNFALAEACGLKVGDLGCPNSHAAHITEHRNTSQGHSVTEFRFNYGMNIGPKIRARREALRMSVEELARKTGLAPSTLYDLEAGRSKGSKHLHHIAEALETTPLAIESGHHETAVREALGDYESLRRIPIVGYAQAGTEDGLFEQVGDPDAEISFNTKDHRAYALRVRGDSMSPRIRPGEIIVVTPSRAPHPGDDVVVATSNGRKMVKHLLYRRGGMIALGSINQGHAILTLPQDEILEMHYVAGYLPPAAARDLLEKGE